MGKSQKKRSMRRHNPMRVPDSHLPKGLASASSSSSKKEAILPILQKMQSPDGSERKWACVAVSNLIQNDPSTRRLLQGKNVVGELITRLSDNEEEVVIEATGALRNLCIDGGYDICGEMYNKNILAPLKTFPAKISSVLSQFLESPKSAPSNAQKVVYEFADNVITILWCLSETSNKALNAINQIGLVPFLMSFLGSRDKLPASTVASAAQCLYVLTEDNHPVVKEVRSNPAYISCLSSIIESTASDSASDPKGKEIAAERLVSLRLLACGILRNLTPLPPDAKDLLPADYDRLVALPLLEPVLSSISLPEASNRVQTLVDKMASEPQMEKLSLKNTPKTDHKTDEELELERIEARLRTVLLGLEILTGVSATLPEPEVEVEGGEDAEDGEAIDEEVDVDGVDGADANGDADEDMDMDEGVVENGPAFSENNSFLPSLVQPLLSLIQPTPLSFPPPHGQSPHLPTTSALSGIHISALECLNNIFLSLASSPAAVANVSGDKASGTRIWEEVWRALLNGVGVEFGGPGQDRRRDMWDVGVGVLWGVSSVWKGLLVPDEEKVQVLMKFSDATMDQAVRVRCIGTLECLAHRPEALEANRVISSYLLSMLPSSSEPSPAGTEAMIQAASALIDIYSDENTLYDVNFRRCGYLERLVESVEGVRKAVRGIDKKREGGKEMRRRGDEVRDNLVAFVKYRRGLRL